MWKGLRTGGLDNDTTMKRPIETVKESRCISSCTPHTQCLCFHEIQRWWPRGLKGHSERTCPPCAGRSTSSVLGRTGKTDTNPRHKTPVPVNDLIPQKETCQSPLFCCSVWEQRGLLEQALVWTCWQPRSLPGGGYWRKGQYRIFLAVCPLPPKPGAKVKGAALRCGSTKLLVSSLFCLHPSDHTGGVVHSNCSVEQRLPQHRMASTSCRRDLITTRSRAVKPGVKKSPFTQCGLCIIAFLTSRWPTMGWVEFLSLQSHFLSSALWVVPLQVTSGDFLEISLLGCGNRNKRWHLVCRPYQQRAAVSST